MLAELKRTIVETTRTESCTSEEFRRLGEHRLADLVALHFEAYSKIYEYGEPVGIARSERAENCAKETAVLDRLLTACGA